jgi:hypothetical protein
VFDITCLRKTSFIGLVEPMQVDMLMCAGMKVGGNKAAFEFARQGGVRIVGA